MTLNSLSTIGKISGGLKKILNTDLQYISESLESPSSPLRSHWYSHSSSSLELMRNIPVLKYIGKYVYCFGKMEISKLVPV